MKVAAVGRAARPATAGGDPWLWGGRALAGAAAIAAGTALGRGGDAMQAVLLVAIAPVAIVVAVVRLRWCLVGLCSSCRRTPPTRSPVSARLRP